MNLYFYPRDNSLELYDVGMKRIMLKRTITEISLNDIYIGAKLMIYGKKIIVRKYGNQMTEQKMSKMKQRYLNLKLLVTYDSCLKINKISVNFLSFNKFTGHSL